LNTYLIFDTFSRLEFTTKKNKKMKKNLKKMQLKKRSISTLNAHELTGGTPTTTIGTTSLLTIAAKSFIHQGEDNCVSNKQ